MKPVLHAEIALFTVALIWGLNVPIMKVGLAWLPPLLYNTVRMFFTCLFALAMLRLAGRYQPFDKKDWLPLLKISICGFFVFQIFFTYGINRTTAGNAALLLGMLPVWVAILNRVCGMEELSRRVVVGIVLSFAGIMLIVLGSGRELSLAGDHLTGALLLMAAQIGYAYFTVFSKGFSGRYSHYQVTAFVVSVNTLLFLLIGLPDIVAADWGDVPAAGWFSILYSACFAMGIGNILWIWGVSQVGSSKASLYNNIAPAFAILGGYVILGETFGLLQAAGAGVTFTGLYLTRTGKPALAGEKR